MGEHVEKTLETITRVEVLLTSRGYAAEHDETLVAHMDLLYQIRETKRVLHGFKPGVEARHPVRRELHRAVVQMEAMVRNWWNSNDRGAKWLEHFLGSLFDLRWWTMVAASQKREDIMSIAISMFRIKHKGAGSHHGHFSSSASEQTEEGRSIFRQDGDLANMVKLEELLPERLSDLYIVGGETFVSAAASPLISEELTLDLCQDVLGVSRTGSWVIRTMYQEVDCALKRVTCDCQPVLARLSHPHIVQLLHYWRKEKYLFLMMELMDGDLTDVLKRSLLSLPVAVDILLQTAKAMLYLHDLDVSYPSLSCSNILFREERLLQDGHMEYTIKLAGGGYDSTNCDFPHGTIRDLHRFGTLCLAVLTGRPQCEDLSDVLVLDIPEGIPQGLRSCITSCFEDNRSFRFEQVVTLLLLAKFQVLKGEAVGSQGCETVQPGLDRAAGASAADADFQEYPLYQLYPEQDVSDLSTTLIFFHGFAKSPDEYKSTWMTRNREHVWPEAWLPKDLPQGNLRILSLSYDTEASSDDRDVGAIELAKKVLRQLLSSKWNLADPGSKVVFIGHSFGGLIIKRLVVEAHNQANGPCSQFLRNLEGVVFYGVPGSATDQSQQYEEYITKLKETSVLRRSSLLEALLKDRSSFDMEMQILGLDFEHCVPEKTRILHFIEGKGMKKILGKQIVSDASARAQPKNVIFHELKEDNHFEVCRPVSKDHEGYKILVEVFLKDMVLGSCQSERDKGKRRRLMTLSQIYGRPDGAQGGKSAMIDNKSMAKYKKEFENQCLQHRIATEVEICMRVKAYIKRRITGIVDEECCKRDMDITTAMLSYMNPMGIPFSGVAVVVAAMVIQCLNFSSTLGLIPVLNVRAFNDLMAMSKQIGTTIKRAGKSSLMAGVETAVLEILKNLRLGDWLWTEILRDILVEMIGDSSMDAAWIMTPLLAEPKYMMHRHLIKKMYRKLGDKAEIVHCTWMEDNCVVTPCKPTPPVDHIRTTSYDMYYHGRSKDVPSYAAPYDGRSFYNEFRPDRYKDY